MLHQEQSGADTAVLRLSDTSGSTFGEYMRSLRKARNLSVRQLAKAVHRTPTYISDIENGNNKPPDRDLLEEIIESLALDSLTKIKENLYDLAAIERGDIPADIKTFIADNPIAVDMLRALYSNPDAKEIMAGIASQRNDGGTGNDAE